MHLIKMFAVTVLAFSISGQAAADIPAPQLGGLIYKASNASSAIDMHAHGVSNASSLMQNHSKLGNTLTAMRESSMETTLRTRGSKEITLYKNTSPSVVLIVTESGTGTGSIISSRGEVLTNWHVIKGFEYVDVIYKPIALDEDEMLSPAVRARVVKIDEVGDLALLSVLKPDETRRPLTLSPAGRLQVGADTHAIGHPLGYSWTYTKGIVSQYRRNQNWTYELGYQHVADVVQTQTPINPGNSGGPLLNNAGQLIGVNSYRSGGESVNFAVAVTTVNQFLAREGDRLSPKIPGTAAMVDLSGGCDWKVLEQFVDEKDSSEVAIYDLNCDGEGEAYLQIPTDNELPIRFYFDTTGNGAVDMTLLDINRDEKWDISFYDVSGNGEPDIVGYHGDDSIPYQFDSYARFQHKASN